MLLIVYGISNMIILWVDKSSRCAVILSSYSMAEAGNAAMLIRKDGTYGGSLNDNRWKSKRNRGDERISQG